MTAFRTLLTVVWSHVVGRCGGKIYGVSGKSDSLGLTTGTSTPALRGLPGAWLPASPRVPVLSGCSSVCQSQHLGAWLVSHPGLLLSVVGGEERLPGRTRVAGLGSEACPGSKTTRPRPPSALGGVHLLLWFLSSIRTSHDGTFHSELETSSC